MVCIDIIGSLHPLKTKLDEENFQHIIYALNSIMLTIKEGKGLNQQTIIKGGKTLFRLAKVIEYYARKKNKENIPASKMAERLLSIVDDAHGIFVGGIVPELQ